VLAVSVDEPPAPSESGVGHEAFPEDSPRWDPQNSGGIQTGETQVGELKISLDFKDAIHYSKNLVYHCVRAVMNRFDVLAPKASSYQLPERPGQRMEKESLFSLRTGPEFDLKHNHLLFRKGGDLQVSFSF